MRIHWFGHACFGITAADGTRILTDPFDESVGYPMPGSEFSVITMSHGHFDHAYTGALLGRPRILRDAGEYREGKVAIRAVEAFHDAEHGHKRGKNLLFLFDDGEIASLHAGDLGHILTPGQILALGRVDVLLIPVGGTYTLDAEGAWRVVEQLKPRIVVPMHYKTDALAFPLAPVDPFLEGRRHQVLPYPAMDVTSADLPAETEIRVLSYV